MSCHASLSVARPPTPPSFPRDEAMRSSTRLGQTAPGCVALRPPADRRTSPRQVSMPLADFRAKTQKAGPGAPSEAHSDDRGERGPSSSSHMRWGGPLQYHCHLSSLLARPRDTGAEGPDPLSTQAPGGIPAFPDTWAPQAWRCLSDAAAARGPSLSRTRRAGSAVLFCVLKTCSAVAAGKPPGSRQHCRRVLVIADVREPPAL